ncbi:MAG: C4-dicarboxylate ABC transporter substrate-binding protein [Rhodoferax sp.]
MQRLFDIAAALVLALALLLCAQWPLRDWVGAYSRQANDFGQVIFAFYSAVAISAASRAHSHLRLHRSGHPTADGEASWRTWASLACVAPWALFVLWSAWSPTLASVLQRERFGEGNSPGYFLLRVALLLLAALVVWQALAQALHRPQKPGPTP